MLPQMQGDTFVKTLKKISNVYIIVLTAIVEHDSKITLLKYGADDYITKPFSFEEVILKIRNIEERLNMTKPLRFKHEKISYRLDIHTQSLFVDGQKLNLNATETNLLAFFINHVHQTLTRDQIIDNCLSESEAFDRIVDTYIKNLRKKMQNKTIIETVYGVGYRFNGDRYV